MLPLTLSPQLSPYTQALPLIPFQDFSSFLPLFLYMLPEIISKLPHVAYRNTKLANAVKEKKKHQT